MQEQSLLDRLRIRAHIRRNIQTRKSVQEGKPDRIADLLEEAANYIEQLETHIEVFQNKESVMGVWSHVEGSITVHKDDHFSVEKALHDYFDDYEACVSVGQKRITNEITKVTFDFHYCMENEGAYKVWKTFVDHVKDNISLRSNTCGMDATVSIRWLI